MTGSTTSWFILVVFVIHLGVFSVLYVWRRSAHYALLSLAFVFLVASAVLKLGQTSLPIGGLELFWYPRVMGWGLGLVALVMLIRQRLLARR